MTAYTPNLPALITALPGDATRAPQTEFDRARQVSFLENLSVTGSVRSAASAAQVSHQTAYRARRATPAFRTAWDGALVVARVSVADTVGCRAIDGITEPVFYHGEEVGSRTRFSDRLLLAHLARLDRLAETPAASAFAEDWDAALCRFEAGEAHPEIAPAPEPEKTPPGPCNTRSMSNTPDDRDEDDEWELGYCEEEAIREEMAAARPLDAPPLALLGDRLAVRECQRQAYLSGDEEWWRIGEDYVFFIRLPDGGWVPDPEELALLAREGEDGEG